MQFYIHHRGTFFGALRYLIIIGIANLAWEFAQFPFYTMWWEATIGEILYAGTHCTIGDILIAAISLLLAILVTAWLPPAHARHIYIVIIATSFGVGYTVFSEWLNTEVLQSWSYTELMPRLPVLGTGLLPLAQWMMIPPLAFWWAGRAGSSSPRVIT